VFLLFVHQIRCFLFTLITNIEMGGSCQIQCGHEIPVFGVNDEAVILCMRRGGFVAQFLHHSCRGSDVKNEGRKTEEALNSIAGFGKGCHRTSDDVDHYSPAAMFRQ
jgi:hypothetical protein